MFLGFFLLTMSTNNSKINNPLMERNEINVEKRDSENNEDFTVNMENSETNSNLTPRETLKSDIKQEQSEENETILPDIDIQFNLFEKRCEKNIEISYEAKDSLSLDEKIKFMIEEYPHEVISDSKLDVDDAETKFECDEEREY